MCTPPREADLKRIALFIDLTHGFNERVLQGVVAFARPRRSWIFHHFQGRPDHLEALVEWRPDGVITAVPDREQGLVLESLGIPVVNVSNVQAAPGLPHVANDNEAIGTMGARHLLERGHRRCAFIGWPFLHFASEREAAFRRTVAAAGATCSTYMPGPVLDRTGWYQQRLAADRSILAWLTSLAHPIGMMAANDQLAWRVAECCRQAGIRIPEDVALVGVDDDETVCHLSQPPLSSIQVGAERIGHEAAAMLDQLLGRRPVATRVRIPPSTVVVRRSSDLFAIADPLVQAALEVIAISAHEALDVSAVVGRLAVSRRTLERRFEEVLERSVLEEIQRVRIERAKTLIAAGEADLGAIARACGFANASRFTRTFTRLVGMPPRSYRRRWRESIRSVSQSGRSAGAGANAGDGSAEAR